MEAGQRFGIHTDTGSEFSEYEDVSTKTKECRKSKFTVLGDEEFVGGETQFFTDDFVETVVVAPKRGRVLLFDIDRYHRANEVKRGVKTWIGIELVFASPSSQS